MHIGSLVHDNNATKYRTIGFSPFFLMFGRDPTLTIDLVFGLDKDERSRSLSKYISNLQKRLEEAYRTVNTASDHSQLRQQYYNDQKKDLG